MIALPVHAAPYATLELSDTTAVRARASAASGAISVPNEGVDLATAPIAKLRLREPTWELNVNYAPTLTLFEIELGANALLMNSGGVYLTLRERHVTLTIGEYASYGDFNSLVPYSVEGPPPGTALDLTTVQSNPQAATFRFLYSNSEANVGVQLDRRSSMSFEGGFSVSGGADSTGSPLPLQYGPRAIVGYSYQLTHTESIATTLTGDHFITEGICPPLPNTMPVPGSFCRDLTDMIEVRENYTRRFPEKLLLNVGAGIGYAVNRGATTGNNEFPYPLGMVQVTNDELSATAFYVPIVDPRTGSLNSEVQAVVTYTKPLGQANERPAGVTQADFARQGVRYAAPVFHATLGFAQTVPPNDAFALTVASGTLGLDFPLDRQLTLKTGVSGIWQDQTGFGTLESAYLFVALKIAAPTLSF